jgi:hypothetical protein
MLSGPGFRHLLSTPCARDIYPFNFKSVARKAHGRAARAVKIFDALDD